MRGLTALSVMIVGAGIAGVANGYGPVGYGQSGFLAAKQNVPPQYTNRTGGWSGRGWGTIDGSYGLSGTTTFDRVPVSAVVNGRVVESELMLPRRTGVGLNTTASAPLGYQQPGVVSSSFLLGRIAVDRPGRIAGTDIPLTQSPRLNELLFAEAVRRGALRDDIERMLGTPDSVRAMAADTGPLNQEAQRLGFFDGLRVEIAPDGTERVIRFGSGERLDVSSLEPGTRVQQIGSTGGLTEQVVVEERVPARWRLSDGVPITTTTPATGCEPARTSVGRGVEVIEWREQKVLRTVSRSGGGEECTESQRDLTASTAAVDRSRYRGGDPVGFDGVSESRVYQPAGEENDSIVAIASGRVQEAGDGLAEMVAADPEDASARRLFGLALIELGEVERGVWEVGSAYSMDPGLCDEPIDAVLYENESRRLGELVTDVVRHANRHPNAEAWLTVAVLMQAEGRETHALRMLGKAERLGLDPVLAGVLEGALRR